MVKGKQQKGNVRQAKRIKDEPSEVKGPAPAAASMSKKKNNNAQKLKRAIAGSSDKHEEEEFQVPSLHGLEE